MNPNARPFQFGANAANQQQQSSQQQQQRQADGYNYHQQPDGAAAGGGQYCNPNGAPNAYGYNQQQQAYGGGQQQPQYFNPYAQQQQQQSGYYQQQSAQYFNPNQPYPPQQQSYNAAPASHQSQQRSQPRTQQQPRVSAADRNKAFDQQQSGVRILSKPTQSAKPATDARSQRANLPLPGEKPAPSTVDTTASNAAVEESADGSWEDLADDGSATQQTAHSTAKATTSAVPAPIQPVTISSSSSSSAISSSAGKTTSGTSSKPSSNKTSPTNSRSATPTPAQAAATASTATAATFGSNAATMDGITKKMSDLTTADAGKDSDAMDEGLDGLTEEERKELAEIEAAETAAEQQEREAAAKAQAMASIKQAGKRTNLDVDRPKVSAMSSNASGVKSHDDREHLNLVFIGHVDAGKSTISGQILLLTGQVDERTMQKYKAEAESKAGLSWYLAYIMDTNEEEREKGKTVEVGRAHFNTDKKRYTLLDAPGHKNYVPNMIGGAQQADVGVLVISARKGEFEAGFDKGGQTREHAQLAKTLGLQKLIVLVNKMDDPSVAWSQERYNDIYTQLSKFLKQWGYKEQDVIFIPVSGYTAANIKDPVPASLCPWYTQRKSFFQVLDDLPSLERDPKAPLRVPVISKFKDMGGVYAIGKIESGTLIKNSDLIMVPTITKMTCVGVEIDEEEVNVAKVGENVLIKLKGVSEEDILSGYVLSYPDHPCRYATTFDAQVRFLELLDHKPVVAAGYQCVMHIHAAASECYISGLISKIDPKTGTKEKKRPKFAKDGDIIEMRIKCDQSIAIEPFSEFPQLGRFTLRDEGKTIAIGKVLKLVD